MQVCVSAYYDINERLRVCVLFYITERCIISADIVTHIDQFVCSSFHAIWIHSMV